MGLDCLLIFIMNFKKGVKCRSNQVTATTGMAASGFGAQLSTAGQEYLMGGSMPHRYWQRWHQKKNSEETDILLINEIPMLSSRFFELAEEIVRKTRSSKLPFGDLQVILFGDLL